MADTRVKINTIIQNQLPDFIKEEYPLFAEFLKQYYISIESQSGPLDILQNIDQYVKIDELYKSLTKRSVTQKPQSTQSYFVISGGYSIEDLLVYKNGVKLSNNIDYIATDGSSVFLATPAIFGDVLEFVVESPMSTYLTSDVDFISDTINVGSTYGFPDKNGIIQINSEIILYSSKTSTKFNGCVRGFSGITSYKSDDNPDKLVFSTSEISEHSTNDKVLNLSSLFLKEFIYKIKKQLIPGFENREFSDGIDQKNLLKQIKDFYSSKGTDASYQLLFKALFGQDIEVLKPRDFLFKPSDAQYRIVRDLVVESISGNPLNLKNKTLYQDKTDFYSQSYGTITNVEKISRGGKEYYVVSLDYDYAKDINVEGSVYGNFSIHPITKLTSEVNLNSFVLNVDSTIGFPIFGELIFTVDDNEYTVQYSGKNLTQFFVSSPISKIIPAETDLRLNAYAYAYDGESLIKIRITGVLSGITYDLNNHLMEKGDTIKTVTLGYKSEKVVSNNWIFNIPNKYNVKQITGPNSSNLDLNIFSYTITTYDPHNFTLKDTVELISTNGEKLTFSVLSINNEYSISIEGPKIENINSRYIIRRNLKKSKFSNYPLTNNYAPNIQNIYVNNNETDVYVAANSLPNYLNENIEISLTDIIFSGSFDGETLDLSSGNPNNLHGLYSGDSIAYVNDSENGELSNSLNLIPRTYYVKRVDETKIKLANSRSDLYNNNFITVSGTVTNNVFTKLKFQSSTLSAQNYIKNIKEPDNSVANVETPIGPVGIFVNGVEAYNYKSKDKIYYGGIESINVLSGGSDFDIISPPTVSIEDSDGINATAVAHIDGSLERIELIDGGFDYIEEPIITITGGNGYGAYAKANLTSFKHSVSFNSTSSSQLVDLSNNTIGFSSYHKFRDYEKVVYVTQKETAVGGLSTNSQYYVNVQDAYKVTLHKTLDDAVSGINTINLTSYGTGIHEFESYLPKRKISNISVINKGSNYSNKKVYCSSSGINTSLNFVNIRNHGYNNGEIVVYNSTGDPIGGLTTNTSYYVTKITDDQFKLSQVGISSTNRDFYYKTNQFINFTSIGSSSHIFNYPNIIVSVSGKIGVSTISGQDFGAKIQPIFRGSVSNIFVNESGVGYGSSEIINYERQPIINLNTGSGAEIAPIINNGKITEVLILNGGKNYTSPPTIYTSGIGTGAVLTAIINDGKIVNVKVINSGSGFAKNGTSLNIISSGNNFKCESKIKSWTINTVEKYLNTKQIFDDDGIIEKSSYTIAGLQYCHLYAPRKLRRSVFGIDYVNGKKTYVPDLKLLSNRETVSNVHSPIIGWAYDGNPIYGPYGFTDPRGFGPIKSMISGYISQISNNRPNPISSSGERIYPEGFFVEDYQFNNSGDLDEHNGRFCVTPEYPNGIYAYFSTINNGETETDGVFKNYKKPIFPYLVGNTFKSNPNQFNYDTLINQNVFDFSETDLLRNTTPYNLTNKNSEYEFILNPLKVKEPSSSIRSSTLGSLTDIGITTGGSGYKIGDKIIFNNRSNQGSDAYAQVSYVKGKKINSISFASTFAQNIEFYPYNNSGKFVGFCTIPHNLNDKDVVSISGLSTSIKVFDSFFEVGVRSDTLTLSTEVQDSSITGIITYFNVNGSLDYPNIRENDIYKIENEKIKVLSVDKLSSRIKVLREYDSTTGVSHTSSTVLYENTRKFTLNSNKGTNVVYNLNKEIYFNPIESLSIGSSFGVGIGSTLYFSNPGAGITNIFIQTKSIYLPKHNLDTGTELIYSSNGGSPFFVSKDGISSFPLLENEKLYVAKISDDLIGISTYKVGLGSTGSFVGIDSSVSVSTFYFTNVGSGVNHSFKTNYDNVLVGEFVKNKVTVSTASSHGLLSGDTIYFNSQPGISTTVVIKYNDKHRRLIANPKSFDSSKVDLINNTINISNHGYETGEKIIYTSDSPIGGLSNDEIYYIVRYNKDKFKLSDNYFNATKDIPYTIDFTSASAGTISLVNPNINIIPNQSINFDLSDSSLSYVKDLNSYSAFDFKLFFDKDFNNEFNKLDNDSSNFDITKSGRVGVDSSAFLRLETKNLIGDLYYSLVPTNLIENSATKKEVIIDDEYVTNNNKLSLRKSSYSGFYAITGIGSTTFSYNITTNPEKNTYSSIEGDFEYYTNSKNVTGEIKEIDLRSGGRNYSTSPGITSVFSNTGSDAILYPLNYDIGRIKSVDISDIGVDYPSDVTLRPSAKLPQLLIINPFSTFDSIGVSSVGINYTLSPDLVVIDSYTDKVVTDIDLNYNLQTKTVEIVKNTDGIYNSPPKIIPVNNSNGIPIKNIVFNSTTKNVTIELGVNYSYGQEFPFSVGDEILVENVSVSSTATSAKGYNSKDYNYSLFTLTSVNPQYGGSGANIIYNLSNYLNTSDNPGSFDLENSAGTVVPKKYFPIFNPILKKGRFLVGEKVRSDSLYGKVLSWNEHFDQLKLSTDTFFKINSIVTGETSNAKGIITQTSNFEAIYSIDGSSVVNKGWNKETGFLNNKFQVTPDNNYYQYFSYSIKSKIDYETWNNSLGNLNHTVGFKKFSDLLIESADPTFTGISTSQNEGNFFGIVDFVREIDLNCINDFDLAKEKSVKVGSNYVSKEIIFNSVSLQDELQSIGNRVLQIDDISSQFSNVPSEIIYANADTFTLTDYRSKKYVTFVRDKRFTGLRQIYLVSLLHDGLDGYLNQYGRVETNRELGSFDFAIFGSEGALRFYPLNYSINDYDISVLSYGITDSYSGVGNTSLGNIAIIQSSTTTVSSGTSTQTNIVGIASTYRCSKVLVQFSSTNGSYYQFDEITLLNDGSNISILEYGQLSNANRTGIVGQGIGTYYAYISGSNINLDLIPNVGLGTTYIANTLRVSIASTVGVSTGSIAFNTGELKSNYVSISSSPSPTQTQISNYGPDYSGAYYFIVVEDNLNNNYHSFEVVAVNDDSEAYFSEFANIDNNSGLGTVGVGIGSTGTNLYFTPNPDISVDVKVYQHSMRVVDTSNNLEGYSLTNANIVSDFSSFSGNYNTVKKSFNLHHQQNPIFQRTINSTNTSTLNIPNNLIKLPNHFFVTGEELVYDVGIGGSSIGIATTSISGIGTTDKLPSSVFVIKINDSNIRFADSAENALKTIPSPLVLSSVGVGTQHTFTSKKQNSKCLISIDNHIQSPIVSTSTTTTLSQLVQINDVIMSLSGITSIFGGDLLKIDNEIVKVNSVGYGATNVLLVDRGWMGTEPENHSIGSLVTKTIGNYNIVDNTLHFIEAPYGGSPIGTITNRPDSRDYTGITTRSSFNGRVFLRSGIENDVIETYERNYIFDGLTEQFTGLTTEFILKSGGSNITGVSTGSIVLLINNIFQESQRLGSINILGNYKLTENSGITTLGFTGNISSTSYDVNTSSIPRGGVIVSVASTKGFGYQPLISAGGTSIVSVAGTISSISIGYSGSGYRGLPKYEIITQTTVAIGSGSTIIPINNVKGIFEKLGLSTSNTIGIGSVFVDVPIVSVGNTYIVIGLGNTSNQFISQNTSTLITLNSPNYGLVDVGVKTSSYGPANYEFIGFTTISSGNISTSITITNPGSGYTSSNPPIVVFDSPLNYSNIPLIYSSGYSGIGTSATVDIVVGQGSSVIDFQIKNLGYAYKVSEVLTVPIGGLTGIPTDPSKPFRTFELTIDEVFSDLFSAWSIGDMQVIDKIENLFNGSRKTFPIKIDGVQTSIRSRSGSNINVQSNLLIFINDILQVPGSGYIFNGGSIITFTEPPKEGDTCKIIFYKGTGSVDVVLTDILQTIKSGDNVTLNSDFIALKEDERLVTDIISSDSIETNTYLNPGLTTDETLLRPVIWCKQTEDKIIGGQEIAKDRELYESLIQPTTNIIKNVGTSSTEIFVESVKIFFDDLRENAAIPFKSKIVLTSQDVIVGASATAIVSIAGTISSISLTNGGSGFTTSPSVTISRPTGIGSTSTAICSISSGIITSFTITNPGSGYTSTNPPQVLIEYPALTSEKIEDVTYDGDFGIIVGVHTTSVGVASTGIVFDMFIPMDSYLRNTNINVGIATSGISGIKTGYYFTVFNSNIGFGATSIDSNSTIVGIGTSCLDNVYEVAAVSIAQTSVPGIGLTNVSKVTVSILSYNGLSGLGYSNFYGEFSWGKINTNSRKNPNNFTSYTTNGILGLSTSATVQRLNPLRYVGYSTIL